MGQIIQFRALSSFNKYKIINNLVFKYSKFDLTFGEIHLKRQWLIYSLPSNSYSVFGRFSQFCYGFPSTDVYEFLAEFKTYKEAINYVKKSIGKAK